MHETFYASTKLFSHDTAYPLPQDTSEHVIGIYMYDKHMDNLSKNMAFHNWEFHWTGNDS